jgi:primase-polymerase (primpol)-like protein
MTARADARYCSSKHRIYAHRAKPALPAEMTNANRWIRYSDPVKKIPLTAWGEVASSTNSATWTSYGEAKESDVGAGLGFVLGYGIGCIDLDHCMIDGQPTEAAREFVADYPQNYIEVSPSGHGLHVWGEAEEAPGTKRTENGLSVERYSTGRYITITGNVYQRGTLQPL